MPRLSIGVVEEVDPEGLATLCQRIKQGDRAALNELAEYLLPILTRRLRRAYPRVPLDLLVEACEDAVLDYGSRPDRFDTSRGVPLASFLQLVAWRNLANRLEADTRRRRREATYASMQRAPTEATPSDQEHTAGPTRARMVELGHKGVERNALQIWLAGERRTAVLATALGIANLPSPEQRREVKRFKDRLRKRFERAARAIRVAT